MILGEILAKGILGHPELGTGWEESEQELKGSVGNSRLLQKTAIIEALTL
jgi:hypothetical protein